jgi:hypothetical protein
MENKPLSAYIAEMEALANEIDDVTGEIPKELLEKLWAAHNNVKTKTDEWINYLDVQVGFEAIYAEKKKRLDTQIKRIHHLQNSLKSYLKYILQSNPEMVLKGDEGRICLQKNPPALDISFERKDKVFYKAIDQSFAAFEPSLSPYLKQVSCFVVDTERVKEDLAAGKPLNWAKITQDFHVRIR